MSARLTALAAAAFLASSPFLAAPAAAQAGVELGTLTCVSEGSTGYIIGSSENLACTFRNANRAALEEVYVGTIDTIGLDIGVSGPTTLQWLVLSASTDAAQPGILTGRYIGASAEAAVGVGGGVNALVGGLENSVTLQPLSIQGQTGLNAAIGVSSFRLAAVAAAAPATPATPNVIVR